MTIKTRTHNESLKSAEKVVAPSQSTISAAKSSKHEDVLELADKQVSEVIQAQDAQIPVDDQSITGRGVFAVRTLGDAVSVEAAFLAQDGNILRFPAVFPNREYAMAQVDELRQILNHHFDEIDSKN
jgi:hypothetical protein